jgi:hypothetical protein
MGAFTGLPKAGSWLDVDLSDEIAVALRWFGATRHETVKAEAQDPIAAYGTLQRLGAKSDLLRIVGSLGDTLDAEEVLRQLRQWNLERRQ